MTATATSERPADRHVRRTKIVCTIGPATSSEEQLRALIRTGMNVARLNFSHGSHEEHRGVIERVRRIADEELVAVGILQDLAGPKVRVGDFSEGAVELAHGAPFTLTARDVPGSQREVSVSYRDLPGEVSPGDTLLLADGSIQLRVERVAGEDVQCTVVVGGLLSSRKGVNVPSGLYGLPILREKDLEDLAFGVAQGVDFIGLSFVRTAGDVRTARQEIRQCGGDVPVIAKIETQAALVNFDAILAETDGIMIARGDLSIETPFARVPSVQKELIAKANRQAKPVITATQMLFSMVEAPHPTRAEVTDVANAVMDGSDAVMLSDETTVGKHPVRAVATMASIALETERAGGAHAHRVAAADVDETGVFTSQIEAMALAACELAPRIGAEVITTLTEQGRAARYVAKYRPRQAILAATSNPRTYRRLALVRGVTPLLLAAEGRSREEMIDAAERVAVDLGWGGCRGVYVSNDLVRRGDIGT
jgi:pyruvate kinase